MCELLLVKVLFGWMLLGKQSSGGECGLRVLSVRGAPLANVRKAGLAKLLSWCVLQERPERDCAERMVQRPFRC